MKNWRNVWFFFLTKMPSPPWKWKLCYTNLLMFVQRFNKFEKRSFWFKKWWVKRILIPSRSGSLTVWENSYSGIPQSPPPPPTCRRISRGKHSRTPRSLSGGRSSRAAWLAVKSARAGRDSWWAQAARMWGRRGGRMCSPRRTSSERMGPRRSGSIAFIRASRLIGSRVPTQIHTGSRYRYRVGDPDPEDPPFFGPPGSGSNSQRYGSGSFPFLIKVYRIIHGWSKPRKKTAMV